MNFPLSLHTLRPSDRMPVLFMGHGSPLNVIQDTPYRQGWQALGREFGARWPKPQLILCISAHWLSPGWWLTAMAQPPTIHDFGGFPPELFAQQYPAPGWPAVAQELSELLRQPHDGSALGLDTQAWGFDHGAWGVLKPMFPAADIPLLQLSMDPRQPASAHFQLGRQLQPLRDLGVLIVASGNIVHNLPSLRRELPTDQAYDWVRAFDRSVADIIEAGDLAALQDYQDLPFCARAHPSIEHFLPLLYAAGAARADDALEFVNVGFQAGSLSMRSVVWG